MNESSASAHAGYIVLVGLGWYLSTTEKLVITTQHMDLGQAAIRLYVWKQAQLRHSPPPNVALATASN